MIKKDVTFDIPHKEICLFFRMMAKFLLLTALIGVTVAHPQVSIRYFDGDTGKMLEGRSPRLENQEKLRAMQWAEDTMNQLCDEFENTSFV